MARPRRRRRPVAENNARRDEARRQREDAETVRRLMAHPKMRAWFHRVLTKCHIYGTPFTAGESETTFFRFGEENVGKQMMMDTIGACPDLDLTMLAEAKKEEDRVAGRRVDEEKKRQREESASMQMQGFALPPRQEWPGHVPPEKGCHCKEWLDDALFLLPQATLSQH